MKTNILIFTVIVLFFSIFSCQDSSKQNIPVNSSNGNFKDQLFNYDLNSLNPEEKDSLINKMNNETNIRAFIYTSANTSINKSNKIIDTSKETTPAMARTITRAAITDLNYQHNLRSQQNEPLKYWTIDSKGLKTVMGEFIQNDFTGLIFYPALHKSNGTNPYHSLVFGPLKKCTQDEDKYQVVTDHVYYNYVNPCPDECVCNPTEALNYITP